MLITLKGISKLKFNIIFLFFIFYFLFCECADGTVLFKKHTYGRIIEGNHNIRISKITENDDNYVAFLTGRKNYKEDNYIKLFVTLKVKTLSGKVLASITFKNKSYHDRYIFAGNLPYNSDMKQPYYFYSLCEDMFSIFTDDNIKLDYLGDGCELEDIGMESWVRIAPQQEMTFTVILNGSYLFLPGEHVYRIKTAGYSVVDKKWFSTRNIPERLFPIVDFIYSECKLSRSPYFFKRQTLCEAAPWAVDSLKDFMLGFFPVEYKDPPDFKVYSNVISIKVNGSEIRSFYDTPRSKRS